MRINKEEDEGTQSPVTESTEATSFKMKLGDTTKAKKAKEKRMIRHIGEDPTKFIAEITPGKKGGVFDLPFGGRLSVGSSLLGKKDVVTCCMVSPSDRYKYLPSIRDGDYILSEVYLLAISQKSLKGYMDLTLPYYEVNTNLFDIELLWKKVDADEWSVKQFHLSSKDNFLEFQVESGGIFVVISKPKCETFEIPVQGCLYSSKLSHQVSVRFPKKATAIDIRCDIVISPVNRENLPNLQSDYPRDMDDLVALSDYVTIQTNIPTTFKRPATIKLPLPAMDVSHYDEEDMVVLVMTSDGWQLQDAPLKFTKSAVMFDTKVLSRYCVALSKPRRKRRLVNAFRHLQEEEATTRGQILAFLHVQEKLWTLWIEICKEEEVNNCVEKREEQGFRRVKRVDIPLIDNVSIKRSFRGTKAEVVTERPKRAVVDLSEGQIFEFEINGELKVSTESSQSEFLSVYYHDRLKENYKRVFVEPSENPEENYKNLSAKLSIFQLDGGRRSQCIQSFEVGLSTEEVYDYFYVCPPTPEPEPEPEVESEPIVEESPVTPRVTTARPPTASFLRLITPLKPPRKALREAKVLTGKSLMCLAREIEQGLTLAIHLDISDSTITGMGFDALANGLSLKEITYRILLMWKRKTNKFRDRQVDLLTNALKEMGRNDVATIVSDSHKHNQELTPSSFEIPVYPSNIIMG